MSRIRDFVCDRSGASAAEYALMLAIVGTAVAAACLALGNAIHNSVFTINNCLASASSGGC
jgi:pilus assembly protein Flp/PilA